MKLEIFSNYVARQLGFKDESERSLLRRLRYEAFHTFTQAGVADGICTALAINIIRITRVLVHDIPRVSS